MTFTFEIDARQLAEALYLAELSDAAVNPQHQSGGRKPGLALHVATSEAINAFMEAVGEVMEDEDASAILAILAEIDDDRPGGWLAHFRGVTVTPSPGTCQDTHAVWGPHPGCAEFMSQPEVIECGVPATVRLTVRYRHPASGESVSVREYCAEHAQQIRDDCAADPYGSAVLAEAAPVT